MEFLLNFRKTLSRFWSPIPAVIALGVLSAYYFGITGTYWAVTGEFTRWGGHFLQLFGVDVSTWGYYKLMSIQGNIFTRVDGVMIIGMFAGCIAAAFWGNNVKFRLPLNNIRIYQALIGGIIAGFGARLGMAMLFGAAFGLIIAKAQICFTSAFRDIFTTGRSELAIAIIIGMAVATLGVFTYLNMGAAPKIFWTGPNVVIGGLLFGFGIVIAGGCECGWMYRAVEGQVHFWIVGVGNIIGATLLAFVWDDISEPLATSWPKINLLESFGQYGGLVANYGLLFLFFIVILVLEKKYLRKSRNR